MCQDCCNRHSPRRKENAPLHERRCAGRWPASGMLHHSVAPRERGEARPPRRVALDTAAGVEGLQGRGAPSSRAGAGRCWLLAARELQALRVGARGSSAPLRRSSRRRACARVAKVWAVALVVGRGGSGAPLALSSRHLTTPGTSFLWRPLSVSAYPWFRVPCWGSRTHRRPLLRGVCAGRG